MTVFEPQNGTCRLCLQILGDGGELFQGGFEVVGDFLGDDFGGG